VPEKTMFFQLATCTKQRQKVLKKHRFMHTVQNYKLRKTKQNCAEFMKMIFPFFDTEL